MSFSIKKLLVFRQFSKVDLKIDPAYCGAASDNKQSKAT
jgi:hypothetical protein